MSGSFGLSFGRDSKATRPASQPLSLSAFLYSISFYGIVVSITLLSFITGSGYEWLRSLFIVMVCGFAAIRVSVSLVYGRFGFPDPILLLPLFGIAGLAVLQTLPFPEGSPLTSVDPFETKAFVVLFSGLLVAGEALLFLTDSPYRLRVLTWSVIIVGACSALFGIAHDIITGPDGGYAQFTNRNHFAFLAEMSLGLTVGILIKGGVNGKARLVGWTSAAIIVYSLLTSGSRGGLVSLVAMVLFAVYVQVLDVGSSRTRSGKESVRTDGDRPLFGRILVATGVCAAVVAVIVIAIAVVGGDRVVTRIERVGDEVATLPDSQVNRAAIWKNTVQLIKERPVFGVGFGGLPAAITRFDASSGFWPLQQAHNDYLELLANGGIVGFGMFSVFGILAGKRAVLGLAVNDRLVRSSCFGACIGITGLLVHSAVDFGLHEMINAFVALVLIVIATIGSRPQIYRRSGSAVENVPD